MIEIRPFTPSDYYSVEVSEEGPSERLPISYILPLAVNGLTYTFVDKNDNILAVAGLIERWPGRYEIWASVNARYKNYRISLHRAAKRLLEEKAKDCRRIEATVRADFKKGRKWLESLGFVCESDELKAFYPDGETGLMYARVNNVC